MIQLNSSQVKNRGFTLFIAITLTATLLLVAAGVVALAVRQSFILNSGRESQHAFYAADSGIECALYWDMKNPSGTSAFSQSSGSQISCNNQTMAVGGNSVSTFTLNLLPDAYCAIVTVTKTGGGTTATDSSGNGSTGTLLNNPTWVTGHSGSALSFDGGGVADDIVSLGKPVALTDVGGSSGNGPRTITAWIYPTGWGEGGNGIIFRKTGAGAGWLFNLINTGPTASFQGQIASTGTNPKASAAAGSVVLNKWQFVAMTWQGTVGVNAPKLYLGSQPTGVSEPSYYAQTSGNGTTGTDASLAAQIGNNNGATVTFDGIIDEVSIYSRALSSAEISTIYQNGVSSVPSPIGYWQFNEGQGSTKIESRGYNTCSVLDSRRVERALRATY